MPNTKGEKQYYIDGALVMVSARSRELPFDVMAKAEFIYCLTDHKVVKSRKCNPEIDEDKMLKEGIPKHIERVLDTWKHILVAGLALADEYLNKDLQVPNNKLAIFPKENK